MALIAAGFYCFRPLRNVALVSQPAPAVIGFVALSTDLWRLTKVCPQVASFSLVTPDIQVDCFMGEARLFQTMKITSNLLRAVLLSK